jgi:hypothetical protein
MGVSICRPDPKGRVDEVRIAPGNSKCNPQADNERPLRGAEVRQGKQLRSSLWYP